MSSKTMLEKQVSRMTRQELITAYLELLARYEAADAFRQRVIDRNSAVEKANQAIQERSK